VTFRLVARCLNQLHQIKLCAKLNSRYASPYSQSKFQASIRPVMGVNITYDYPLSLERILLVPIPCSRSKFYINLPLVFGVYFTLVCTFYMNCCRPVPLSDVNGIAQDVKTPNKQ